MTSPQIPVGSTVFVSGQKGYWTVTGYNSQTLIYFVTSDAGNLLSATFLELTLTSRPVPLVPADVETSTTTDQEARILALETQVELLSDLLGVPWQSRVS